MRAAEALRLGSLVMEPLFGQCVFNSEDDGMGCAIGMINKANGVPARRNHAHTMVVEYPWMRNLTSEIPCKCPSSHTGETIVSVLAHVFNMHVAPGRPAYVWNVVTLTIDQLADWLDSVDPTPRQEEKTEVLTISTTCEKVFSL